MRPRPTRHGAALIMAMLILMVLLFIGLPLILSQTASLSGSAAFRGRQETNVGRSTAAETGIGLAVHAQALHLTDPDRNYSKLDEDLVEYSGRQDAIVWDSEHNLVLVDPSVLRLDLNDADASTRIAFTLQDESGKLDVNSMDAAAWHKLLEACGIADWDDDQIPGEKHDEWDFSVPREKIDDEGESYWVGIENDHDDFLEKNDIRYGELAETLARVRYKEDIPGKPRNRITNLNQLLEADTNEHGRLSPHSGDRDNGRRTELTPGELEIIRPHLTTFGTGQGRGGLVDVGTVIGKWEHLDDEGNVIRGLPNRPIYDADLSGILSEGSALVAREPDKYGEFPVAYRTTYSPDWSWAGDDAGDELREGDPIALEVPSPVNINQASDVVRYVVLNDRNTWRQKPAPDRYTSLNALRQVQSEGLWADSAFELLEAFGNRYRRDGPTIDLRSWGLVRVTAGAASEDGQRRPIADSYQNLLVQAAPQEEDVVLQWDNQAELIQLRGLRHTSRLQTWPAPVDRFEDQVASENDEESGVGLRFDILPNWASITTYDDDNDEERLDEERGREVPRQVTREWSRRFNEKHQQLLEVGSNPGPPAEGPAIPEDMRPDGFDLSEDAIAYRLKRDNSGPLKKAPQAERRNGNKKMLDLWELDGGQLSFWFMPTEEFEEPVILAEIPAVGDNQMPMWDGSTSTTGPYQNYWRLWYDPEMEYIIFEMGNPAIEHQVPYGHRVPEDDYSDETVYTNEQSLGEEAGDLAVEDLAPPVPELGLKMRYLYKVIGGFEVDRWYHLQLIVSSDRPGDQLLMLDGLAGRNANTIEASEPLRTGDHIYLPCMLLDTDLPNTDIQQTGAGPLVVDRIELRGNNILEELVGGSSDLVEAVFPRRGIVLIGNESISYESIDGNALVNCRRGLRVDTDRYDKDEYQRWPTLEEHLTGDKVIPSGFRFQPGNEQSNNNEERRQCTFLYKGGASTLHTVGNGDPAEEVQLPDRDSQENPHRFRNWFILSNDPDDYDNAHKEYDDERDRWKLWIDLTTDELIIQTEAGYTTDMPPAGFLRIRNMWVWYNSFDNNQFSDLTWLDVDDWLRLDFGSNRERYRDNYTWHTNEDWDRKPLVIGRLTSLAVNVDANIIDPNNFPTKNDYFQIEHPDTGRIEWIRYDRTIDFTDSNNEPHHFFYASQGWDGHHRGRHRTIFAGIYNELSGRDTLDHVTSTFPPESAILPVQRRVAIAWHYIQRLDKWRSHRLGAHWFESGDVLTILPEEVDLNDPQKTPRQIMIRYAASDGYMNQPTRDRDPPSDTKPKWGTDTHNDYFALTEKLDANIIYDNQEHKFEFVQGLGWSGADLTPHGAIDPWRIRRGLMPRIDGMMSDYSREAEWPALWFGGNADQAAPMVIDAINSGFQPGGTVAEDGIGQIIGLGGADIYRPESGETLTLEIGPDDIDFLVATSNAVFRARRGLIYVDGEIMAYQRSLTNEERREIESIQKPQGWKLQHKNKQQGGKDNGEPNSPQGHHYRAKIIGRGLLGTAAATHRIRFTRANYTSQNDKDFYVKGPTALHLPIGPIYRISEGLSTNHFKDPIEPTLIRDAGDRPWNLWRYAPAALLAKKDGTGYEMAMLLTNSRAKPAKGKHMEYRGIKRYNGLYTAPWLRGLYNTKPLSFEAGDLIIGWWPRYPSVFPGSGSETWMRLSPDDRSAMLRCRSYAWFGIPARFRDCFFPDRDAISLFGVEDGEHFSLRARSMPDKIWTGNGWSTFAWSERPEHGSGDIGAVFSDDAFNRPVEGAEVKVYWRYSNEMIDGSAIDSAERGADFFTAVAGNANRSPRIRGFNVKVRVPTLVLENEGTR